MSVIRQVLHVKSYLELWDRSWPPPIQVRRPGLVLIKKNKKVMQHESDRDACLRWNTCNSLQESGKETEWTGN